MSPKGLGRFLGRRKGETTIRKREEGSQHEAETNSHGSGPQTSGTKGGMERSEGKLAHINVKAEFVGEMRQKRKK